MMFSISSAANCGCKPDCSAMPVITPGRAMGMTTIKVGDPAQALAELEAVLGHPLR